MTRLICGRLVSLGQCNVKKKFRNALKDCILYFLFLEKKKDWII